MSAFSTTSSTSSSRTGTSGGRARSGRSRHHRFHHRDPERDEHRAPNDVIESITAAQARHSERYRLGSLDGAGRRPADRRRQPDRAAPRHHDDRSRQQRRSTGWDPSWNSALSAQLSQYIQRRDAEARTATTPAGAKQRRSPSPPDEEEKRVKALLRGLEEAITCGQFDKAAVLAKQLAAAKQRQTGLAFDSSSSSSSSPMPATYETCSDASSRRGSKPLAAKRTLVPAVPAESSAPSGRDRPVPAKRGSKLETSCGRRTLEPEQSAGTTGTDRDGHGVVPRVPPPAATPSVRQASAGGGETKNPPEPAKPMPEPTIKSPTKVDSSQQTTVTYGKPVPPSAPTVPQQGPEILATVQDSSFKVRILIEDRGNSHTSAPLHWSVTKETTLGELKDRMERERGIPAPHQRWILGRRLANDDKAGLEHYDVVTENASLYVYVLADQPRPAPVAQPEPEPAPRSVAQPTRAPPRGRYYNFQEDRYSTCEESSDDEPGGKAVVDDVVVAARVDVVPERSPRECERDDGKEAAARAESDGGEERGAEALHDPLPPPKEDYEKLLALERSDLVPNADQVECPVCLMAVPVGVGVTLRDCLHSFCKDCLAHVVEFSDEPAVPCPYRDDSYHCDSSLLEREIKALVPDELYEKHLARSVRLAEKRIKNTFHCQTADCTGWAVIEDNVNAFACPVCGRTNCLTCQAIHDGLNCKEYQDRLEESAGTDQEARQTQEMIRALVAGGEALPCPNCRVVLMKRWGCDWVRCSVCRTEICWVTKQSRWGPKGKGDTTGGCRCGVGGVKCHALCNYCH